MMETETIIQWAPPEAEQAFRELREAALAEIRSVAGLADPVLGRNLPPSATVIAEWRQNEVEVYRRVQNLQAAWGRMLADFYARHAHPIYVLRDDFNITDLIPPK